jgi:predicted dehydrogenase
MASKLRFGLIGCGGIAKRVLPEVMKSSKVGFVAVAAADPKRAKAFGDKLRLRAEASYTALLKCPDIDAVYIALPESLHAKWSIAAAKAGKHVLCEKTLAPSYKEVQQMVAAAKRHKVRLLEAFMWRFAKGAQALKREAAALGQPQGAFASFGFVLGSKDNYRNFKKFGGGALNDIGCYAVTGTRFLLGEPVKVHARMSGGNAKLADRHGVAWLEFPGGALATIEFSFAAWTGQCVMLSTAKGSLNARSPFTFEKRSLGVWRPGKVAKQVQLPAESHYRLMFEGFATEVRRQPKKAGAFEKEALQQAKVMQALRDSDRTGRPVRL